MTDSPDQADPNQRVHSPFAGCIILIVMALVALVLVSSAGWALKNQANALASFTEEEPKPAPLIEVIDYQTDFNSLISRLDHFEHEMENKRATEIRLSPSDLNLAIAHFEVLQGFRGQLSVDGISEKEITGKIHLPLNSTEKLPSFVCSTLGIEQRPNNLNGNYQSDILLTDGQLIATLTKITPPQGELPPEFLDGISRLMVSGEVEETSPLHEQLKTITAIQLTDGALVFTYDPESTPPSVKEESTANADKAKQFVALGAVIFILTMILAFIIISRWRKNRRISKQAA